MSLFSKFKNNLQKTSNFLSKNILSSFQNRKVDSKTLDELETILISADISLDVVEKLINSVSKVKSTGDNISSIVLDTLSKEIENILILREKRLLVESGEKKILIFVGVNGSGKTTTIGKIVNQLNKDKKILIGACDTFRAAAIDQLKNWADKNNSDFYTGEANQDPASVAYQAAEKFNKENYDYLIIDTAGRLSNNTNLINQLVKLKNVVNKINTNIAVETVLVLDGTNGSNMIKQVDIFGKELNVTSIIITKLDGTAKGGALISIANKYEIPISYIGLGEKAEDLINFSARNFARSILDLSE
ncbi:MAG: signal recognition particle-docking protein FtsY [Pelagibacteraceae bacterium]|jgi:fused signal recognition particle receptor|nr:signal recognition particle-docking protein FtsY [Pelagibacteraceae bacterium]MBT6198400.1 signal recognition particle-docking protein FtsY [Pelagibacteraceae bacterium]MBT6353386.1 signal recognition particle-docking protein FtsY [Pelagibacteraceae bacterium]